MAKIITREWTSRGPTGRRVRHVSYGYDLAVNGKRERHFSTEWLTEADALGALTARLKAIDAGQLVPPAARTLKELADEYLQYKTDRKKRSLREDRRIIKTRILPAFGADLQVKKLTGPMIAQYEKRRSGEVSAFTVGNELTILRHMLRLGRRWGYLAHVPDIEPPKKPEGRRRYLDEAEIGKLLTACAESRNKYLGGIVALAVNTGMRKGEVLGLEWERIDLSSARITLYDTKNGTPRGVPMNRAVYDALITLAPAAEQRAGLVFKARDGGAWGQIRTAFATALRKAGIQGFRLHDLRHTAASHLVMRGASLKEVQEVLGHKDFKMTLRYAHLSPAHLRAAVDRLDGLTEVTTKNDGAAEPVHAAV